MNKKNRTNKSKKALDFRKLRGSVKTKIKLTDKQLREARGDFEKNWARPC